MFFVKSSNANNAVFLKIAKLMLKKQFLYERVCDYIKEEWLNVRRTNIREKLFVKQIMHRHLLKLMFSFYSTYFRYLRQKPQGIVGYKWH